MVNQQPGRLQRLGEPRKTIVHVEKIERVKGRAMTDETKQALLPVTQGGPRITVKASCFDCPFVVSESYHVQSDSGSNVYCAHPSFEKRRRVGDTIWDTPDFCPVADIPAIRARVLSHSLPRDVGMAGDLAAIGPRPAGKVTDEHCPKCPRGRLRPLNCCDHCGARFSISHSLPGDTRLAHSLPSQADADEESLRGQILDIIHDTLEAEYVGTYIAGMDEAAGKIAALLSESQSHSAPDVSGEGVE